MWDELEHKQLMLLIVVYIIIIIIEFFDPENFSLFVFESSSFIGLNRKKTETVNIPFFTTVRRSKGENFMQR